MHQLNLPKVPEVAVPTPECPTPAAWQCYDGEATEVEVLEFLYSLVRMLKPELLIETGSYLGIGTSYLAAAVKANGKGRVVTCEAHEDRAYAANSFLFNHDLDNLVVVNSCTGETMIRALDDHSVGFAFLDSALGARVREMEMLLPKLKPGAVVAVHDTNTYHAQHGGPRNGIKALAAREGLDFVQFDTPRGLSLIRNNLKSSLVAKAY